MLRRRAGALVPALVALLFFGYLAVAPDYYRIRWLRGTYADEGLLRKSYSLVAFTVTGFLLAFAARRLGRAQPIAATSAMVALFSAAIEIAQRLAGSHESLVWNVGDVAFGAAGGALGAYLERRVSGGRRYTR
jgi:hypothetical protein